MWAATHPAPHRLVPKVGSFTGMSTISLLLACRGDTGCQAKRRCCSS